MSFLRWLRWWFIDTRGCNHLTLENCYYRYYNYGNNKIWICKKCGKIIAYT